MTSWIFLLSASLIQHHFDTETFIPSFIKAVYAFSGPAGFGPPLVVGTGPRYIDLMWKEPIVPNGILLEYKVYQNGQYRESVSLSVLCYACITLLKNN